MPSGYQEDTEFARGRGGREDADFVLAPGEFALVQDGTKGHVSVYVGPLKATISQTDLPVKWDSTKRQYNKCAKASDAVCTYPSAPEGSYLVLNNPYSAVKDGVGEHPPKGTSTLHVELQAGRKINIPGPATFPLWPGQSAEVIQGHRLRSNQYLMVRVYNDEEARRNWEKAVKVPQAPDGNAPQGGDSGGVQPSPAKATDADPNNPIVERLTMGQLIVVKGTDVSFYIPPTGLEVVPDESEGDRFVRSAVTLERLEFCILLDESGEKRYVQGPAVVFPKPTETFMDQTEAGGREKTRKSRAIELNEIQGLYVKVIADYEEGDQKYRLGQELFITGKDQAIYYPRPEHSIIRYGGQTKHYATVIPAGEARYVLDRMAGDVQLMRGPKMFLADPRKELQVRRVLSEKEVTLWFPGNVQVVKVNDALRRAMQVQGTEFLALQPTEEVASDQRPASARVSALAADSFERGTKYTEPRTITLDTKFDGAVRLEVWPGYAVLVMSKTGKRRVVQGPGMIQLEYDEILLALALSTSKPKTTDKLFETVYLKVKNNTVSDIVKAETKDLVPVEVKLSYRVNFEGDKPEKWFDVDNYVKFLTDHARSLLRHAIKQSGIEDFYADASKIIRDTILGVAVGDGKERRGLRFEENGMRVYDVEVLDVKIVEENINRLLAEARRKGVEIDLKIASLHKDAELVKEEEDMKRANVAARAATAAHQHGVDIENAQRQLKLDLEKISNQVKAEFEQTKAKLDKQGDLDEISKAEVARAQALLNQTFDDFKRRLEAKTTSIKEELGAVNDKLADALTLIASTTIGEEVVKAMAPLVALGGGNAEEMFSKMVAGTFLQDLIGKSQQGRRLVAAEK